MVSGGAEWLVEEEGEEEWEEGGKKEEEEEGEEAEKEGGEVSCGVGVSRWPEGKVGLSVSAMQDLASTKRCPKECVGSLGG